MGQAASAGPVEHVHLIELLLEADALAGLEPVPLAEHGFALRPARRVNSRVSAPVGSTTTTSAGKPALNRAGPGARADAVDDLGWPSAAAACIGQRQLRCRRAATATGAAVVALRPWRR